MEGNRSFVHGCGQKVIVLGWAGSGYWREPDKGRGICGVVPLKGDRCTCGGTLGPEDAERAEFSGRLFDMEVS